MNRRQKIIVSVTGIFIVLLALVGLTYGYFLTRIQGNTKDTSVIVESGLLELTYTDGNGILTPASVLVPGDSVKFLDASNNTVDSKTFSVTNTGDRDTEYVVFIDKVSVKYATTGSTTTFESNDFRYTLTCTIESTDESRNGTSCNGTTNSVFPLKNNSILVGNDIVTGDIHNYSLTMEYLETDVDQSNDMNKTLSARINIEDINRINPYSNNTSLLTYNIINNAVNKTNGTELLSTPKTKVAEETSIFSYEEKGTEVTTDSTMSVTTTYQTRTWTYATDYKVDPSTGKFSLVDAKTCIYNESGCISDLVLEGKNVYVVGTSALGNSTSNGTMNTVTGKSNVYRITEAPAYSSVSPATVKLKYRKVTNIPISKKTLSTTIDDYGTSYYYRGNVEDNYVNFAGMCWRIVRIAGDGSTKLILEDRYTTCDDTETETTSAVYTGNWNIGTGNYGYELKNVDSDSSNEYIMNYLKPVTSNTSSMVKAFYDFQTTKLADYTSKLKSGDWCLGDKVYTRSGSSGSYTYTPLEEYNYSSNMYYDAYTRLTSGNANGYQPTLKCNGTVLDKFATVSGVSSEAPMYVSAITADEIVYAGGKYGDANENYYLLNNYQKSNYDYFWSLSPYYFNCYSDDAFHVDNDGYLFSSYVNDNDYVAFRPAVSLASSVSVTGGEGTLEKPYVIG